MHTYMLRFFNYDFLKVKNEITDFPEQHSAFTALPKMYHIQVHSPSHCIKGNKLRLSTLLYAFETAVTSGSWTGSKFYYFWKRSTILKVSAEYDILASKTQQY